MPNILAVLHPFEPDRPEAFVRRKQRLPDICTQAGHT
jgi:hypothetical protein